MNYKRFLTLSGIIMLASALLGHLGLGPTANASALGSWLYFDINQSIVHALLGAISLAAAYFDHETVNRYVTAGIGIFAILISAFSLYRATAPTPNLYVANIETPLESLVYLALGLWALWVVLMPPGPIFVKDELEKPNS